MPSPERRRSRLSPEQQALVEQRLLDRRPGPAGAEIPRRPDRSRAPLSLTQRQLWVLDRMEPASPLYNVPRAVEIRGELDLPALASAIRLVVARHEGLRSTVRGSASEPHVAVDDGMVPAFPVIDLSAVPAGRRRREAEGLVAAEAGRPFDLVRGPLVRVGLVRCGPGEHVLTLTLHHIVADARSLEILFAELGSLYARRSDALEPPAVDYGDFAAWQAEQVGRGRLARDLAWWVEHLAGPLPETRLPFDRPRSRASRRRGALVERLLPPALRDAVTRLARSADTTPFVVIAAALGGVLDRYGERDEVVLGTVLGNRPRRELEDVVGYFVNPVALRCACGGEPTGAELVQRMRATLLQAMDHGAVPFELVVQELAPDREPGRNPLFQVMLVYQSSPPVTPRFSGLGVRLLEPPRTTAKFDLSLECWEAPEGLRTRIEYPTVLFDATTAMRIGQHLEVFLDALAGAALRPVSELPLLSRAERHAVLVEWTGAPADASPSATVDARFRSVAGEAPDRIAVVDGRRHVSYGELARRARALAATLGRRGVGPESPVGVCLERSVELVVSFLAVLEAGGHFVPLDPSYPRARHELILEDAGPAVVIAEDSRAGWMRDRDLALVPPCGRDLEDEIGGAPAAAWADRLAYVMYTSGSTGRPKGVAVPHRAILRLVRGSRFIRFGPDEVFLGFAPAAFDASTLELWGPLLNGGRLEIHPTGPRGLDELVRFVERRRVTTLWLTAALFGRLGPDGLERLRGVRHLLAGGDVLPSDTVRDALRTLPGTILVNGYGPTENTTFTCCHPMGRPLDGPDPGRPVPIGRPIANSTVEILDGRSRPVPVGVPGELFAGGAGLARCYLDRPGQTAERFVPDRFASRRGDRVYRTGDLVRWRADGTVEFLGRTDDQVKVRGHRVEPEEVAAAVRALSEVSEAVVVVRGEAGDRSLVAYAVARQGDLDSSSLLARLREVLPEPLVPSAAVILPSLPLNAHGKLDRTGLPEPERFRGGAASSAPTTPVEQVMAEIWADLLELEEVGRDDDFFSLGGHSVRAMELVELLQEMFEVTLPLAAVFEHPTVAGLCARLAGDPETARRMGRVAELVLEVDDLSDEEVDALVERRAAAAEEGGR